MSVMKSYEDIELALSTLAAGTSIKTSLKIDASREQGCRIKDIRYGLTFTAKPSLGPILVGLCDSNLTVAELDECLDSDPQSDLSVPGQADSMRKVVPLALIPKVASGDDGNMLFYEQRRAKWYWDVLEGSGIQLFARNMDDTALTGATLIDFSAVITGTWLLD